MIGIMVMMAMIIETILTIFSVGIYMILCDEAFPLTNVLIKKL